MQPDDEGCVWVLFTDADHVVRFGVATEPDGREPGPLGFDGLAHIIGDVDPRGAGGWRRAPDAGCSTW